MGFPQSAREVSDLPLSGGRLAAVLAVPAAAAAVLWWMGPVAQPAWYHLFADRRTLFGIPHFWNTITNAGFLAAGCYGFAVLRARPAFAEAWERTAHFILAGGVVSVAFGSAYYHLRPDDARLVWDRLTMTIPFTALIALFVGERMNSRAGKLLLVPAVAAGILSVLYWRRSGDLRAYLFVQAMAVALLPVLMWLYRPRYRGSGWLAAMLALYAAALLLDLSDRRIGAWIVTGGHPWKHVSAAAGIACYFHAVAMRTEGAGSLTLGKGR